MRWLMRKECRLSQAVFSVVFTEEPLFTAYWGRSHRLAPVMAFLRFVSFASKPPAMAFDYMWFAAVTDLPL